MSIEAGLNENLKLFYRLTNWRLIGATDLKNILSYKFPIKKKLIWLVMTCLLYHLLTLGKGLTDQGVRNVLPLVFLKKKIWLEIGAEFWKYKSAQPKKRMGQHLFTSRCFNRETFSRKDSYIFRFWNALLRTIFLNVHRSIAHRDPLVWAWGGRWMLEIEEQESSTMMMMMMKMMMMMIKRKV